MCLYIDPADDIYLTLRHGTRTARKKHTCDECRRVIGPGETYRYQEGLLDGSFHTAKTCPHCWALIKVGHAYTGCPILWNGEMLYDPDPDIGFVANCLRDEGHDLTAAQRDHLEELWELGRSGWRSSEDVLVGAPEPVAAPSVESRA